MIFYVSAFLLTVGVTTASASKMGVNMDVDLEKGGSVKDVSSFGVYERDPTFTDRNYFDIGTDSELKNLFCNVNKGKYCGTKPAPLSIYLTEKELDANWKPEWSKEVGKPSVKFTMSAVNVEILDSDIKLVAVDQKYFKNNSSKNKPPTTDQQVTSLSY